MQILFANCCCDEINMQLLWAVDGFLKDGSNIKSDKAY